MAETCTTAALEGSFRRRHTSSGAAENISGARCIVDALLRVIRTYLVLNKEKLYFKFSTFFTMPSVGFQYNENLGV